MGLLESFDLNQLLGAHWSRMASLTWGFSWSGLVLSPPVG